MTAWTASFEIPDHRLTSDQQAEAREIVMDAVATLAHQLEDLEVRVLLCDTHGDEVLRFAEGHGEDAR